MDHQIRTASQAYRAKIGAAFRYVWAPEEFNTVHGPNFNPDWITWKERELPGPSVKMKKTEVDFVKVKKGEEMIMLGSARGHMSWKSAQILDSSSWDKSSHHHKLMAVENFL